MGRRPARPVSGNFRSKYVSRWRARKVPVPHVLLADEPETQFSLRPSLLGLCETDAFNPRLMLGVHEEPSSDAPANQLVYFTV